MSKFLWNVLKISGGENAPPGCALVASCATSEMSVLSSSATENVTSDLTLPFSWRSKFAKMSEILFASVSRQANIGENL